MRKILLLISLILATVVLAFSWGLWNYLTTTPGEGSTEKYVTIPSGTHFNQVAKILEEKGVIVGAERFRFLAWLRGIETEVKAGDYHFNTAMTPREILDKLVLGEYRDHKITIPEGFSVFQIAEVLEREGIVEKEKFLKCASDPDFVHSLNIKGDTLEGFLFPDTYLLRQDMGEERILRKMVARFNEMFKEQYVKRAQELTMSLKEVITLASIVEKETSDPSERHLIAAVFRNRLKRKMLLQSDPSVIYGLKDFNGNLTKKDLMTDTVFNTYLNGGLPPQPIANPGEESIKAVLYPSPKNYLYFVSKNDGTHHFSATLREHNQAVNKYQRKRGGG